MLDGDHYRTAELINQLMVNAQIKSELDLIEALNPDLTIVDTEQGNKAYSYNYKNIIISGGETVAQAMNDFNRRFYNQKP